MRSTEWIKQYLLLKIETSPTGCWEWQGGLDSGGYGCSCVNGKRWVASRLSWTVFVGKIPEGKWVLHKCDNPSCIKPTHLYIGTAQDNSRDQRDKWITRFRTNLPAAAKRHIL